MTMQKLIAIGRVGADPEIKQFQNGGMLVNVSIACSEKWKDKQGNQQEHTEWVRVVFNGRLAEIVGQYVKKGALIYIEGKLRTRKYQDQQGQERHITEIRADSMQMLGGQGKSNQGAQNNQNYGNQNAPMQGYPQHTQQQAYAPQVQGQPNWAQQPQQPQTGYAGNPAPLPIPQAGVVDDDIPF